MRTNYEALESFYGEIPEYIAGGNKSSIVIRVSDWTEESQELKITIDDVLKYYAYEANNLGGGCRTIAGFTSDWRPIDNLASEALEYFKTVNPEALRRECKRNYSDIMQPSF